MQERVITFDKVDAVLQREHTLSELKWELKQVAVLSKIGDLVLSILYSSNVDNLSNFSSL